MRAIFVFLGIMLILSCGRENQNVDQSVEDGYDASEAMDLEDFVRSPTPSATSNPFPTATHSPIPSNTASPSLCSVAPFPVPTGCTQDAQCPNFAGCTGHCVLYSCVWTQNN